MSTSEKFSLKFFQAVIQAAKGLSQDEIEQIENGEAKIELLINGTSRKAKKVSMSDDDLNAFFEKIQKCDLNQRQAEYKAHKLPKRYVDKFERSIKRTETLMNIASFTEQNQSKPSES